MSLLIRTLPFFALVILCALSFAQEGNDTTESTIKIGTSWAEAREILKRHKVPENQEYPALGFSGAAPDWSETQYRITPHVNAWFTRDANNALGSIVLHVYDNPVVSKPGYRRMKCEAVSFHSDRSYFVRMTRRPATKTKAK